MISLIDKVAELLPTLEARGVVYLFALAEREDFDRWDVVLCSEWSDDSWEPTVRFVADLLGSRLDSAERRLIVQIAVIPSSALEPDDMPWKVDGATPADRKLVGGSLLGSPIRRAYVFKAQFPPTDVARKSLANAAAAQA